MSRHDLYGSHAESLEAVKASLEPRTGWQFDLHNSYFWGGDYCKAVTQTEQVKIHPQFADEDGLVLELEFSGWPFFVYVDASDRWADLELLLPLCGLTHLRTTKS